MGSGLSGNVGTVREEDAQWRCATTQKNVNEQESHLRSNVRIQPPQSLPQTSTVMATHPAKEITESRPLTSVEVNSGRSQPTVLVELTDSYSNSNYLARSITTPCAPQSPRRQRNTIHFTEKLNSDDMSYSVADNIHPVSPEKGTQRLNPRQQILEEMLRQKNDITNHNNNITNNDNSIRNHDHEHIENITKTSENETSILYSTSEAVNATQGCHELAHQNVKRNAISKNKKKKQQQQQKKKGKTDAKKQKATCILKLERSLSPLPPTPVHFCSAYPRQVVQVVVPDATPENNTNNENDNKSKDNVVINENANENTCTALAHTNRYYPLMPRSASPASQLNAYESLSLQHVCDTLQEHHNVLRVCLTGGPCAGKSTLMAEIQSRIPDRTGYQVLCVPEAATLLVTGGMQWNESIKVEQQLCLIRTQLSLEDQFYALALASHKPSIVISDRGTMDGRAFCSDEDFDLILSSLGCSLEILRDRYDMVIHMVTAAIGAESYYNLDNPARYEDLNGARSSDLKLRQMYVGHPNFRILDNDGTFESKIERGLQFITEVTGQAAATRTRHFYVLHSPLTTPSVPCASYDVHYIILSNSSVNDIRLLVKRKAADGSIMYFFKSIKHISHATHSSRLLEEQQQQQQQEEYEELLPSKGQESHLSEKSVLADSCKSFHSSSSASSSELEEEEEESDSTSSSFCSPSSTVENAAHEMRCTSTRTHYNLANTQRVERSQRISAKEYSCLIKHRDVSHDKVFMRVTHFIVEGCSYEVMTMMRPYWARGRQTISVESAVHNTNYNNINNDNEGLLPDFVHVDREVPIEQHTTLFLISHKESGQLYASLVFALNATRNQEVELSSHVKNENHFHHTEQIEECTNESEPSTKNVNNSNKNNNKIMNESQLSKEHEKIVAVAAAADDDDNNNDKDNNNVNVNVEVHMSDHQQNEGNVHDAACVNVESKNSDSNNKEESNNSNIDKSFELEKRKGSNGHDDIDTNSKNTIDETNSNNINDRAHNDMKRDINNNNTNEINKVDEANNEDVNASANKLTCRALNSLNANNIHRSKNKKLVNKKSLTRESKLGELPTIITVKTCVAQREQNEQLALQENNVIVASATTTTTNVNCNSKLTNGNIYHKNYNDNVNKIERLDNSIPKDNTRANRISTIDANKENKIHTPQV